MYKNKKAFTLIELMVVVLIIGILSSVAVPQYTKIVTTMRVKVIMSTAYDINNALERYYAINASFKELPTSSCPKECTDFPGMDIVLKIDPQVALSIRPIDGGVYVYTDKLSPPNKKGNYSLTVEKGPGNRSTSLQLLYTFDNSGNNALAYASSNGTNYCMGQDKYCNLLLPMVKEALPR